MEKVAFDSLAVFKTGQNIKCITGGLLKTRSLLPTNIDGLPLAAYVSFTPITPEAFKKLKKMAIAKVFFKGFPHFTTKADVVSVFEQFGTVGYVYFMCESNSGKSPYKMGYLIFDDYRSVDALLCHGFPLSYHNYSITYEEYKSNKKSNKRSLQAIRFDLSKTLLTKNAKVKHAKGNIKENHSAQVVKASKNLPSNQNRINQISNDSFSRGGISNQPRNLKLQIWLSSVREVAQNSSNTFNLRINISKRAESIAERRTASRQSQGYDIYQ
jgi:hypothetical protein